MENKEKNELINRKPYPAVLSNVLTEFDPIRKVYCVRFIYTVYISTEQTTEVVVNYSMWDYSKYRMATTDRLETDLNKYGVNLIPRDYRNELSIINACKWLIGTRVEIKKYKYRTIRYMLVSTERTSYLRINHLWECLLQNKLNEFPEYFEHKKEDIDTFCNDLTSSIDGDESDDYFEPPFVEENQNNKLTPQMCHDLEFNYKKR